MDEWLYCDRKKDLRLVERGERCERILNETMSRDHIPHISLAK